MQLEVCMASCGDGWQHRCYTNSESSPVLSLELYTPCAERVHKRCALLVYEREHSSTDRRAQHSGWAIVRQVGSGHELVEEEGGE